MKTIKSYKNAAPCYRLITPLELWMVSILLAAAALLLAGTLI